MLRRGDKKEAIARRTLLERQKFPLLIEVIKNDRCNWCKYDGTLPEEQLFQQLIGVFDDGIAF
jgi:hypothetical protein